VARTGATGHPQIQAVWLAHIVNRYCGGAVISPFEVDQLSDDWIEVFIGLADDLPKMQTAQKQADQKFVEFRSRMKYRSYLN